MSLEDAAVLGEVFSRYPTTSISPKQSIAFKQHALKIYQQCRAPRTRMVVERGNVQQYLYHLHDGPQQEERDRKMRMQPTPPGEALAWRDPELSPRLLGYDFVADVERHWPGQEAVDGVGKKEERVMAKL
jgi:salicylate hydroxylase